MQLVLFQLLYYILTEVVATPTSNKNYKLHSSERSILFLCDYCLIALLVLVRT